MATSPNLRQHLEPRQDRERLHTLARLAGSVSHAIQSPLTTIFLHADILEEELRQWPHDSQTQLLDSLRVIREEITHMHDLAEQYLVVSRLPTLPFEPEDIRALLHTLVRDRYEQLNLRGIVCQLAGNAGVGLVTMNKRALRHALLNIIDRLVEVAPTGHALTLDARHTTAGLHLDINYAGADLPPEQVSQVFSIAEAGEAQRLGLRMELAHDIVAAHGGTIEVASQPGVGITVTVTLPPQMS